MELFPSSHGSSPLSALVVHSSHAGFGMAPSHLSSGVFFLRTLQFSLLSGRDKSPCKSSTLGQFTGQGAEGARSYLGEKSPGKSPGWELLPPT